MVHGGVDKRNAGSYSLPVDITDSDIRRLRAISRGSLAQATCDDALEGDEYAREIVASWVQDEVDDYDGPDE